MWSQWFLFLLCYADNSMPFMIRTKYRPSGHYGAVCISMTRCSKIKSVKITPSLLADAVYWAKYFKPINVLFGYENKKFPANEF